jgi:predicted dienelactone hydrolase
MLVRSVRGTFVLPSLALAALLGRQFVARRFPAHLPEPSGPYRIGRTACDWLDAEREEPYARGARRELAAWIWYPARPAPGARSSAYLPGWWSLNGWLWGFDPARVRVRAIPEAPAAEAPNGFPVLLFSPSGFAPHFYTALVEQLASHGYVVVGLAHSYETLPLSVFADGRVKLFKPASVGGALQVSRRPWAEDVRARAAVVGIKAEDLRFAVSQLARLQAGSGPLAGRLDLSRLGAFGHSFGGAAAAEFCRRDRRCRAAASLDGGLWTDPGRAGLSRPFLQLFGEHPEYVQPCAESVRQGSFASLEYCRQDRAFAVEAWQRAYTSAQPGYSFQLRGAGHVGFTDLGLLPLARWSPARRVLGSLDARRRWRLVSDLLLTFFDQHLDDPPAAGANRPWPEQPELASAAPGQLFKAGEP